MRQQGSMDMNRHQSIEELTGGRIKKEEGMGKKAAMPSSSSARSSAMRSSSSSKYSTWSGSSKRK